MLIPLHVLDLDFRTWQLEYTRWRPAWQTAGRVGTSPELLFNFTTTSYHQVSSNKVPENNVGSVAERSKALV